jgi:hypothetical protein
LSGLGHKAWGKRKTKGGAAASKNYRICTVLRQ